MAGEHKVWEDEFSQALICTNPVLRGTLRVTLKKKETEEKDFLRLMRAGKSVSNLLKNKLEVPRCALVMDEKAALGPGQLLIVPMIGISEDWRPVLAEDKEFNKTHPGYITSRDGPKADDKDLDTIRDLMSCGSSNDFTFKGQSSDTSLFAKIVRGEVPQWRVWENHSTVAFLTPFPSTPGFTVVVPRDHLSSDILALEEQDFDQLMLDSREVGLKLQQRLGADGFGVICEGMEIDYAHVKVVPLHKTEGGQQLLERALCPRYEAYPGFVTSQPGPELTSEELDSLLKTLA